MEKDIREKYLNTFGIRFLKKQKTAFIKALTADFESLGYHQEQIIEKHLFTKAKSYVFGNMKQMQQCIIVPYDTPEQKFWKQVPYYPQNGNKTASKTIYATFIPLVAFFATIFIGIYIIKPYVQSESIANILSILLFLATLFLIYWMLHGLQNKHNANRNSASIICALSLAKQLNEQQRKTTGFIFTDKNKQQFIGAKSIQATFQKLKKQPDMFYLDCIGNKKQCCIGYLQGNKTLATKLMKNDPNKEATLSKMHPEALVQNAMQHFLKALIISCGEFDNEKQLVVYDTGTRKDQTIDEQNIQRVKDMLFGYITKG